MIPPFRDPEIDPRRWAPDGEWTLEGDKEAIDRMPAFAREIFGRLLGKFSFLRRESVLLRWSVQPEDVNAFFDRQGLGKNLTSPSSQGAVKSWSSGMCSEQRPLLRQSPQDFRET